MGAGVENNEFIITRHSQFSTAINVINIYGNQECRSSREEIVKNWNDIVEEIRKIEAKSERLVLVGDFNRKVGDIIEGNDAKVSFGGSLVRQFLEDGKYVLLNATNKVIGGPWTRVSRSDTQSKSAIDFVVVF